MRAPGGQEIGTVFPNQLKRSVDRDTHPDPGPPGGTGGLDLGLGGLKLPLELGDHLVADPLELRLGRGMRRTGVNPSVHLFVCVPLSTLFPA